MRTALLVAAIAALPLLIYLFMSMMAALARIWRGGVDEAREFKLARFDLESYALGVVPKLDSSSLIPTRAGFRIEATKHGDFIVRETRTISKDVF